MHLTSLLFRLPVLFFQTMLQISSCLSKNASYPTAGDAITAAVTTVQQVYMYMYKYVHVVCL